jgi:hypothetical protein
VRDLGAWLEDRHRLGKAVLRSGSTDANEHGEGKCGETTQQWKCF